MMWGPLANSMAILGGALVGVLLGGIVSKAFRAKLMLVFGCISMSLGVFMISKGSALPPIVAALLLGTVCGELVCIERAVMVCAKRCSQFFERLRPRGTKSGLAAHEVQEQFSVIAVVFCVSGMGFFGAMREGITGDPSLLFIKALLDFSTALIVGANIGAVVGVLALPQFVIQALVFLSAGAIEPLTNPAMVADFTACGGIIMLATGLRMCNVVPFPVLSMLPALLFVMPLSALWLRFM